MSTLQDITKSFLDEIKKVNLSHSPVDWVHARFPKANGGNGFQLWSKQIEIANSVYENQQTIVAACHGSGKSFLAALLTAWFVETYGTDGVVITTAPTSHQVYSVLWQEINKLGLYADPPLPGKILQTEWKIGKPGDERFQVAYGRATREYDSSAFQGKHCLDDQHEILTHRGWCNIDEINQNDEVLSVPLNGEFAEWMPITNIYKYDYDGELLVVDDHPMLNFAVTPSHRFVFKEYYQKKWQLSTLINHTLTCPTITICTDLQNNHGSNPHINLQDIKTRHYCGKIWCISTPYETFVTRRKGKIMWTGNSNNVLLIIDESAGIQPPIWEAVRGLLTSARSRLLVLGNPTEVSGGFYDLANTERFGRKIFHINAFESPNFISSGIKYIEPPESEDGKHIWRVDMLKQLEPFLNKEDYQYPGLVTPQWVYNQLSDYPLSDPFIEARVFGRFPKFSEETVIPFSWVVSAQQRWMDIAPSDVVGEGHIGVDPAAYGNCESICAIRIGNYISKFITRGRTTAQQMVSDINSAVEYLESRHVPLNSIRVDSAGIGIRTCEDLDRSLLGEKSFPINVGSAARDKIRYANLRAELWFKFKELLDPNNPSAIALPPDDRLASQLSAPKYKFNNHRQLIVESKEDLRSRGIKDLGRADATVLASIALEQMHYFSRRGFGDIKSVIPFIPLYQR